MKCQFFRGGLSSISYSRILYFCCRNKLQDVFSLNITESLIITESLLFIIIAENKSMKIDYVNYFKNTVVACDKIMYCCLMHVKYSRINGVDPDLRITAEFPLEHFSFRSEDYSQTCSSYFFNLANGTLGEVVCLRLSILLPFDG